MSRKINNQMIYGARVLLAILLLFKYVMMMFTAIEMSLIINWEMIYGARTLLAILHLYYVRST